MQKLTMTHRKSKRSTSYHQQPSTLSSLDTHTIGLFSSGILVCWTSGC